MKTSLGSFGWLEDIASALGEQQLPAFSGKLPRPAAAVRRRATRWREGRGDRQIIDLRIGLQPKTLRRSSGTRLDEGSELRVQRIILGSAVRKLGGFNGAATECLRRPKGGDLGNQRAQRDAHTCVSRAKSRRTLAAFRSAIGATNNVATRERTTP